MALQRGGDQVVVEPIPDWSFWRTEQGVSKRTKVRARVVANALAVAISKSSNMVFAGHKNADLILSVHASEFKAFNVLWSESQYSYQ